MEGTQQLVAALNRVRSNFEGARVAAVVLEACEPTAEVIAGMAPVRTGALAGGIKARLLEEGGDTVVVAIGPHKDQFYAPFQEFGTATIPPHPFMRPGFDSDEGSLKERLRKGLGELMTDGVTR